MTLACRGAMLGVRVGLILLPFLMRRCKQQAMLQAYGTSQDVVTSCRSATELWTQGAGDVGGAVALGMGGRAVPVGGGGCCAARLLPPQVPARSSAASCGSPSRSRTTLRPRQTPPHLAPSAEQQAASRPDRTVKRMTKRTQPGGTTTRSRWGPIRPAKSASAQKRHLVSVHHGQLDGLLPCA